MTPARRHVRFGVLTDLHLAEPGTPERQWINTQPPGRTSEILTSALGRLADHEIDALLLLGDLAVDGPIPQLNHASLIEYPRAYTVLDLTVGDGVLDVSWDAYTLTPRDAAPVDPFLCGRRERRRWVKDERVWRSISPR